MNAQSQRESMPFDIVIIGAGPAGLSCAIRLMQLAKQQQRELSVCIIEKAASLGAHSLSGAVLEPKALNELLPNWQQLSPPTYTPVTEDHFYLLKQNTQRALPKLKTLNNHDNMIISLGEWVAWLGQQAESLGVAIFPGFAASEILYNDDQSQVIGIATGDMGLDKDGKFTERSQRGIEIHAKHTVFAEGCRGSLSQQLMSHFHLREDCDPQTYGLGLKEVWQVNKAHCQPGKVIHTIGWPLKSDTYGGGFIYHYNENKIAIGLVVGLDYRNPNLDPFKELQRLKTHPTIRPILESGKCISYGARALNEGGWQSIPKLTFPGGLLIGCSAGFVNVAKIKGNHTAMKSGMLAAEAIMSAFDQAEVAHYEHTLRHSWIATELKAARNIRPAFSKGLYYGMAYSALDQLILRGKAPWTFKNHADYLSLKRAKYSKKIVYPAADGKITFTKLNQVFLSGTNHNHNQPCHLKLKDPDLAKTINQRRYDSPETKYCPAGVYEIVDVDGEKQLQINFQNCLHCKTCDIKDPTQNIDWTCPEGGDGPNYQGM